MKQIIYITIGMGVLVLIANKMFRATKKNLFIGRNIVIGDSHAVGIGSRIKLAVVDSKLAKGGWSVKNLLDAVNIYTISPEVGKIFISIGTNGQFTDLRNLPLLVTELKQKFPNATLYAYMGSFGWSGDRSQNGLNKTKNNQLAFYNILRNLGVEILANGLNYQRTDLLAHSTSSPEAKAIILEINSIIN